MSSRKNWIRQELLSLAVVLAAVTVARSSLADHYYVPSGSMEYSLIPGDRVFVDKTAYDTTSILKLITRRFDLEKLPGVRDKMGDLTAALDLQ